MNQKLNISFEEKDGYLLIHVEGEWSVENVKLLIDEVAKEAQEKGYTRVLIDNRKLSAPKDDYDRFLVGEYAAKIWRHPLSLKVASVHRKEFITRFAEDTAVNRGADLFIASNIDKALKWLMASPTKQ